MFATGVCLNQKVNDKSGTKDNMPISLISTVCKIFENMLSQRVNIFLIKYIILSNQQFSITYGEMLQKCF